MPECLMCQKYPGANCSYDLCLLRSLPSVEGVECGVGWVKLVLDQPELSRPQSARVRLSAPSPSPLWASIGWGEQKRGLIPKLSRETRVWSYTPIISGFRLHLLQGYPHRGPPQVSSNWWACCPDATRTFLSCVSAFRFTELIKWCRIDMQHSELKSTREKNHIWSKIQTVNIVENFQQPLL